MLCFMISMTLIEYEPNKDLVAITGPNFSEMDRVLMKCRMQYFLARVFKVHI